MMMAASGRMIGPFLNPPPNEGETLHKLVSLLGIAELTSPQPPPKEGGDVTLDGFLIIDYGMMNADFRCQVERSRDQLNEDFF